MTQVLNTANDQPMKELGRKLLDQLGELASERNLATHTMWASVMPDREVRPHPALPHSKKLQDDFKSQFSNLTTNLGTLLRQLMQYEGGLRVHLEQTARRRESGNAD
jgi:hypothetical protein